MDLRTAYLTDLALQSIDKLKQSADPYYLDAAMDFVFLTFAAIHGDNDTESCGGCGIKGKFNNIGLCNECGPQWEQRWVDSLLVDVALSSPLRTGGK